VARDFVVEGNRVTGCRWRSSLHGPGGRQTNWSCQGIGDFFRTG